MEDTQPLGNYYIYSHSKPCGEVFYIGMSKQKNFLRASSKRHRNLWWNNLVYKYGFFYKILAANLTHKEACELEIFLIDIYGRKDLGNGNLVNLTDGGEGIINPTQSFIDNRSGENCHLSKKILNIKTGEIFISLMDLVKQDKSPYSYSAMKNKLNGTNPNNTFFSYLDEDLNVVSSFNEKHRKRDSRAKSAEHKKADCCVDLATGKEYFSIKAASLDIGINYSSLKSDTRRRVYNYGIVPLKHLK